MRLPSLTVPLAVLFSLIVATPLHAQQSWPEKPVKIVVPYPAGPGPSDQMARLLGEKLSKQLGHPFFVDNRPGASGNLGSDYVAKAQADGHTLLLTAIGPIAINPSLFKTMPLDVSKDLVPVAYVGSEPFVLVTSKASGATSVADLISKIKEKPEQFSYGSSGVGAGTHLAGELFQRAAGVQILHVPYKGGTSTINDVVSGLVPITFTGVSLAASFSKAGKLNVLAVTGPQRSPMLPETPTISEAGLPAASMSSWYGFFVSAKTPRALVERINAQLQIAMQDPEVLKKMDDFGLRPRSMSAGEFSEFVKAETVRLSNVVRAANISIE